MRSSARSWRPGGRCRCGRSCGGCAGEWEVDPRPGVGALRDAPRRELAFRSRQVRDRRRAWACSRIAPAPIPGILWWHRPYYTPSPSLGSDMPRVSLISTLYPWGAQAAVSGDHWDMRAAAVDRPRRAVLASDRRPVAAREPDCRRRHHAAPGHARRAWPGPAGAMRKRWVPRPALDYTTVNAEADFAFGYTRLSGEWVRSRFDVAGRHARVGRVDGTGPAHAHAARVRAQPRLECARAAGRQRASPRASTCSASARSTRRSATCSRRRSRCAPRTRRCAVSAGTATDHQIGLSVIWSRRWW